MPFLQCCDADPPDQNDNPLLDLTVQKGKWSFLFVLVSRIAHAAQTVSQRFQFRRWSRHGFLVSWHSDSISENLARFSLLALLLLIKFSKQLGAGDFDIFPETIDSKYLSMISGAGLEDRVDTEEQSAIF